MDSCGEFVAYNVYPLRRHRPKSFLRGVRRSAAPAEGAAVLQQEWEIGFSGADVAEGSLSFIFERASRCVSK